MVAVSLLKWKGLVVAAFAVVVAAAVVPARPALAASFVVDSTTDAPDAAPGDGICAAAGGACTLRAAVEEANALSGPDAIDLPAGTYALTLPPAGEMTGGGDLDVTENLTITGDDAEDTIIDGGGLDRVVDIFPGATLGIYRVTIRNGRTFGSAGGGIRNAGTLAMADSNVTDNATDSYGGGIANLGWLTVTGLTVRGNAAGTSGGISNTAAGSAEIVDSLVDQNTAVLEAGGVGSDGDLTISDSVVARNTADVAAGIGNRGTMAIGHSTLEENSATGDSGGVGNEAGATMEILSSTISHNTAEMFAGIGNGGTITLIASTVRDNEAATVGGGVTNGGNMTVNASTISTNSATSGAGIVNGLNGTLTATNSTISRNSATSAGAGLNLGTLRLRSVTVAGNGADEEGSAFLNAASLTLKNTLLARNGPTANCSGNGTIVSEGHNLDDDGSCGLGGPGDLAEVDSLIDIALFDHGGGTETHGFFSGSWAVDGGTDCPPADQRGVARPRGAACDIGAFEEEAPASRRGDVNADGRANSLDAAIVLQFNAGLLDALDDETSADANNDRQVTAIDASLILQTDAGFLDGLPPAS